MAFIDLTGSNLTKQALNAGKTLIQAYNIRNVDVLRTPKTQYQIDQLTTQDKALYQSSLGTPVLTDLTFKGVKNYVDQQGVTYNFDDIIMQSVIVTINQTKNIVKTPIQGRPGTVKEYIGLGDYILNINGVINGSNGSYPKDTIAALKNMLTCPIPITIVSWYIQIWDIFNIVVDDFSINPEEGGYSYQPFTINASSDYDIMLRQL